jgi:predicted nucleic acid-binding protein
MLMLEPQWPLLSCLVPPIRLLYICTGERDMMEIVIDTSAVLAVITHEPDRDRLLALADGVSLTAPASLPWEVGNAFSSMLKMRRLTLAQAQDALRLYQRIPVRLVEVSLAQALALAARLNIYAYDTYMLACAEQQRCPLLSLDRGLLQASRSLGVDIWEV